MDQAAAYIKKLRENIEGLKERRALAAHIVGINKDMSDGMMLEFRTPVIEVKDLGSTVEVVLISGLNKNFMFCDVISVLEEEGAEVVNASFSQVANKVFHVIHSQVITKTINLHLISHYFILFYFFVLIIRLLHLIFRKKIPISDGYQ